jgi:hypothetical protein
VKDILAREVMIPIANYVTVKKEDNLTDVMLAIEERRKAEKGHAHRDAIVVDENAQFVGKVTMIDIFRALEPNYWKVKKGPSERTLTSAFVLNAVKEFNLWLEPMEDVCQRGGKVRVADAMHIPVDSEYIEETDTLEKALNYYVMGVHQPLIVRKDRSVTGLLRFGDVFEIIRERMLSCM